MMTRRSLVHFEMDYYLARGSPLMVQGVFQYYHPLRAAPLRGTMLPYIGVRRVGVEATSGEVQ